MAIARLSEFQAPAPQPFTPPKVSKLELIPYVEINGSRTLTDSFLASVFQELVDEGHLTNVFDGVIMKDASDFIKMMKHPSNIPVFAVGEKQVIGFAWLNGVGINHAYGHFCYFKNEEADSMEFGKKVLAYWFSLPGTNRFHEGAFLDVILGSIPSFNTKASHYVQKLGFTKLGEIPNLYMNPFTGERRAGMIHYLERPKNE